MPEKEKDQYNFEDQPLKFSISENAGKNPGAKGLGDSISKEDGKVPPLPRPQQPARGYTKDPFFALGDIADIDQKSIESDSRNNFLSDSPALQSGVKQETNFDFDPAPQNRAFELPSGVEKSNLDLGITPPRGNKKPDDFVMLRAADLASNFSGEADVLEEMNEGDEQEALEEFGELDELEEIYDIKPGVAGDVDLAIKELENEIDSGLSGDLADGAVESLRDAVIEGEKTDNHNWEYDTALDDSFELEATEETPHALKEVAEEGPNFAELDQLEILDNDSLESESLISDNVEDEDELDELEELVDPDEAGVLPESDMAVTAEPAEKLREESPFSLFKINPQSKADLTAKLDELEDAPELTIGGGGVEFGYGKAEESQDPIVDLGDLEGDHQDIGEAVMDELDVLEDLDVLEELEVMEEDGELDEMEELEETALSSLDEEGDSEVVVLDQDPLIEISVEEGISNSRPLDDWEEEFPKPAGDLVGAPEQDEAEAGLDELEELNEDSLEELEDDTAEIPDLEALETAGSEQTDFASESSPDDIESLEEISELEELEEGSTPEPEAGFVIPDTLDEQLLESRDESVEDSAGEEAASLEEHSLSNKDSSGELLLTGDSAEENALSEEDALMDEPESLEDSSFEIEDSDLDEDLLTMEEEGDFGDTAAESGIEWTESSAEADLLEMEEASDMNETKADTTSETGELEESGSELLVEDENDTAELMETADEELEELPELEKSELVEETNVSPEESQNLEILEDGEAELLSVPDDLEEMMLEDDAQVSDDLSAVETGPGVLATESVEKLELEEELLRADESADALGNESEDDMDSIELSEDDLISEDDLNLEDDALSASDGEEGLLELDEELLEIGDELPELEDDDLDGELLSETEPEDEAEMSAEDMELDVDLELDGEMPTLSDDDMALNFEDGAASLELEEPASAGLPAEEAATAEISGASAADDEDFDLDSIDMDIELGDEPVEAEMTDDGGELEIPQEEPELELDESLLEEEPVALDEPDQKQKPAVMEFEPVDVNEAVEWINQKYSLSGGFFDDLDLDSLPTMEAASAATVAMPAVGKTPAPAPVKKSPVKKQMPEPEPELDFTAETMEMDSDLAVGDISMDDDIDIGAISLDDDAPLDDLPGAISLEGDFEEEPAKPEGEIELSFGEDEELDISADDLGEDLDLDIDLSDMTLDEPLPKPEPPPAPKAPAKAAPQKTPAPPKAPAKPAVKAVAPAKPAPQKAPEKPKPAESPAPKKSGGDKDLYNVFLTAIRDDNKKDQAAELIAKIQGISVKEAKVLVGQTLIPAAKSVSKEEGESILAKFKKLGLGGRVSQKKN